MSCRTGRRGEICNDANVKNHVHYSCGNWHVDHGDMQIYPVEKTTQDSIASGSTVDQLLKENHPKLSAMDEVEKYIYIIIGFGAGLILFGTFFMAQELMERNVIPDMTGTTGWMLVQRLVAFASGIILLFTGNGMKKKQVKENDYMDMMIPGKVVGEVPGAKTLMPFIQDKCSEAGRYY